MMVMKLLFDHTRFGARQRAAAAAAAAAAPAAAGVADAGAGGGGADGGSGTDVDAASAAADRLGASVEDIAALVTTGKAGGEAGAKGEVEVVVRGGDMDVRGPAGMRVRR